MAVQSDDEDDTKNGATLLVPTNSAFDVSIYSGSWNCQKLTADQSLPGQGLDLSITVQITPPPLSNLAGQDAGPP
jgi:hypothetical protein